MYKYILLSLGVYVLLAIFFEACYKYFLHKKGIEFQTNLSIFLKFLFIIVPHCIVHFLIGCLILLFVPFNTVSFISRYFSESKIENELSYISKRIKGAKEKLTKKIESYKKQKEKVNIIKNQLEIFYSNIFSFLQKESRFTNKNIGDHAIYLLIFVLQFISFFTTYKGAELIFSSIWEYAPFLFATVIQVMIVYLSNKAFNVNKRKNRYFVALFVFLSISIFFSYTGILISQEPLENRYASKYETYKTSFDSLKINCQSNIGSKEDIKNEIIQDITDAQGMMNSIQNAITYNDRNSKSVTNPYRRRNDQLQDYSNTINQNAQTSNLYRLRRDKLQNFYNSQKALYNFDDLLRVYNEKSISDIEKEDITKSGSSDSIFSKLKQFESSYNNEFQNETDIGIPTSFSYSYDLDKLILGFQNDDVLNGISIEEVEEKDELSTKIKQYKRNTEDSYQKIEAFVNTNINDDDINRKLNELEERKNALLNLPGVYAFSILAFSDKEINIWNCILYLVFAIMIDGISAFLGYLKSRRAESFLYIKSSKDYFDEYEDAFEMLFMSLMKNVEINIKDGQYQNCDNFEKEVIEQIAKTTEYISDFLDLFTLAEATAKKGYTLKYFYNEDELNETPYTPLVSLLIKTNLATITTVQHYEKLLSNRFLTTQEKSYKSNITDKIDDLKKYGIDVQKKYCLLLRSRGENFLREQIPYRINLKKDKKGESEQ